MIFFLFFEILAQVPLFETLFGPKPSRSYPGPRTTPNHSLRRSLFSMTQKIAILGVVQNMNRRALGFLFNDPGFILTV